MPSYQLLTTYTALESARGMTSVNSPRLPARAESIGPPLPMLTWCSTTQAPGSGLPGRPGVPSRSPRPVAVTRCPSRRPEPPPASASSARALRSKLAEVFRIHVLQVGLQGVRVEGGGACAVRRFAGLDRGEPQQVFAGEDGRLESQRHGDRIRRPGVDVDHRVAAVDVQLGVVGVLLDLRDDDLAQIGAEAEDDLLEEI